MANLFVHIKRGERNQNVRKRAHVSPARKRGEDLRRFKRAAFANGGTGSVRAEKGGKKSYPRYALATESRKVAGFSTRQAKRGGGWGKRRAWHLLLEWGKKKEGERGRANCRQEKGKPLRLLYWRRKTMTTRAGW